MTFLGRIMTLFPILVCASAVASLAHAVFFRSWWSLIAVAGSLYVLPLMAFRAHQLVFPLKQGGSRLAGKGYSPWYGGHQIQLIYIAFPALETVLRLFPGVFSVWLRLWGSRVGRRVYWTPLVEISDRSLLAIGDDVIFGHRSGAYGHIIKPTGKNLLLYVKQVQIGHGSFIGAGVALAPGVVVHDGAMVEAGTHLYPNAEAR
jgi:hypothetical protein